MLWSTGVSLGVLEYHLEYRSIGISECRYPLGANSDHHYSAVTGSVNINVGAVSVTSATQCQYVTVSVDTRASIVSVVGERQCQYNQWSVHTIVTLSVVSILKLHIPKWKKSERYNMH
jgi:hypothetical protein